MSGRWSIFRDTALRIPLTRPGLLGFLLYLRERVTDSLTAALTGILVRNAI